MESVDPSVIQVLAVTTSDVVTAIEANVRRDAGAVLRVTPPFSGRMRARIHVEGGEGDYGDPPPVHVAPERFVERVFPFPTPDETEDELRADPEVRYSSDRHRDRHETEVECWRRQIRDSMRNETTIPTPAGPHEVRIVSLG